MRQDAQLTLAEDALLVRAAGNYLSTNSLDLESTSPRQIGNGEKVVVYVQVTTAFAGGTNVTFQLIEDANPGLDDGPVVLAQTGAIADNDLVAGFTVNLEVPIERIGKRYLGVRAVGAGTHTGGAASAGIYCDHQTSKKGWPAVNGN